MDVSREERELEMEEYRQERFCNKAQVDGHNSLRLKGPQGTREYRGVVLKVGSRDLSVPRIRPGGP